MRDSFGLAPRARAAGIHLLLSGLVALAAAALVFGLWYPGDYRLLAGGRGLFLLVVGVDVVLGPLLTFVVFNPAKSSSHLRRDLAVIALIQLAALAYGLTTVHAVRPVALVFETDRFRVISAADVFRPELPKALPAYRQLPLTGPWLLGTRAAEPGDERNEALLMALNQGIDKGQRPLFWVPYDASRSEALARARPVSVLIARYPQRADEIEALLAERGLDAHGVQFLPVIARGDWVALLNPAGDVAAFFAADAFF